MFVQPYILAKIKSAIPVYNDWPTAGVRYKNTVELLKDPVAFSHAIDWFSNMASPVREIFAPDARGFIFGSATAINTHKPMRVVRKPGKLPGPVWSQSYELEYGTDRLEIQQSTDVYDRKIIIIDDVLATGGTVEAICHLLHNNLGIEYSIETFRQQDIQVSSTLCEMAGNL